MPAAGLHSADPSASPVTKAANAVPAAGPLYGGQANAKAANVMPAAGLHAADATAVGSDDEEETVGEQQMAVAANLGKMAALLITGGRPSPRLADWTANGAEGISQVEAKTQRGVTPQVGKGRTTLKSASPSGLGAGVAADASTASPMMSSLAMPDGGPRTPNMRQMPPATPISSIVQQPKSVAPAVNRPAALQQSPQAAQAARGATMRPKALTPMGTGGKPMPAVPGGVAKTAAVPGMATHA